MGLGAASVAAAVAAGAFVVAALVRRERPGSAGREGRQALRLAAGGLAVALLGIAVNAAVDLSIGRLRVVAALALLGLLAVVVGGVLGVMAVVREGERSRWVYATLPVSFFALLWVVAEVVEVATAA